MERPAGNCRRHRHRPAGVPYRAAVSMLFLVLLGSHMATPLYPLWQERFGLSAATVTVIYACYPVGVIAGLLYGGRLGDQFGRKPPILAGLLLTVSACLAYLLADGMGFLIGARLVNGLAIGLLSGPAAAAIVELQPDGDRAEASRRISIAMLASPAGGLLVSTLIVRFVAEPAQAVFMPFLLQLAALAAALLLHRVLGETLPPASRRSWRTASYRPQTIAVAPEIRTGFTFAALAGTVFWSSTGLWLALGPTIVIDVLGPENHMFGGLAVVAYLTMAGLAQTMGRRLTHRRAIITGLLLMLPSVALINLALGWHSLPGLLAGAAMAGTGQGLGWMGCSELMNRIVPGEVRASVLSALYITGYVAASLPAMMTGWAADLAGPPVAVLLLSIGLSVLAAGLALWNPPIAEHRRTPAPAGDEPAGAGQETCPQA